MGYDDDSDELVENTEYDDEEDYNEELEDSLGDEVSLRVFVPFLLHWYFPNPLMLLYFSKRSQ